MSHAPEEAILAAPSLRIWPDLLPELAERIASCLSQNERACSLRLVNRAAAGQFRGPQHTSVRLSQPVPPHAFARHWGAPGATRGLPYRRRLRLLCLTAASGSIPNMEVALAAAGCLPTCKVFCAAVAAGQQAMCEWLMERRCPGNRALEAAAGAGREDMCEWLTSRGADPEHDYHGAARAAARGGHVGLTEKLVQCCNLRADCYNVLLAEVAAGCDLATLQRLHREWLGGQGAAGQQPEAGASILMPSAAGSRTPDWRAKVEWLEGVGYPWPEEVWEEAAACPDAVERLTWLRQRGRRIDTVAAASAASAGNLAALQYLHAEGVGTSNHTVCEAAAQGHLQLVAWCLEAYGPELTLQPSTLSAAAECGSLELLAWLHERGCPWDKVGEATFEAAAWAGNEAALALLAERGCPMPVNGGPYKLACWQSDVATVRCLARLGCPWGPPGDTFSSLVKEAALGDCDVEMLKAVLDAGCPVDWEAAEAQLRGCEGSLGKTAVAALLAEERALRERL